MNQRENVAAGGRDSGASESSRRVPSPEEKQKERGGARAPPFSLTPQSSPQPPSSSRIPIPPAWSSSSPPQPRVGPDRSRTRNSMSTPSFRNVDGYARVLS